MRRINKWLFNNFVEARKNKIPLIMWKIQWWASVVGLQFLSPDLQFTTLQPPLVGEVSPNFCWYRVPRGQRDGSLLPYSRISRPEPLHLENQNCWTSDWG
jgi:hypothetical protein